MTPPRNRIKPRKPESQIARKPAWSPGFLQKRLLQTRGCAAVINRFVILHGRLTIGVSTPSLLRLRRSCSRGYIDPLLGFRRRHEQRAPRGRVTLPRLVHWRHGRSPRRELPSLQLHPERHESPFLVF